jgi:hypothetical protein
MASPKTEDQPKTPETQKIKTKEELSQEELDKVAGGRRKVADPCDGGE